MTTELIQYLSGPFDGEIVADDRRLPEYFREYFGLYNILFYAVYERTEQVSQDGHRLYRYVRTDTASGPFRVRELKRLGFPAYAALYGPEYDPPPITVEVSMPTFRHYMLEPGAPVTRACESAVPLEGESPCLCGEYVLRRKVSD